MAEPSSNETNESRQPDDIRNTQVNNPSLSRIIKNEHQLTPQWSIESQMSHTSSDRSMESDALDSRSTNTSEEHHYTHHPGQHQHTYSSSGADPALSSFGHENEYSQGYVPLELKFNCNDGLDDVLQSLNVEHSQQNMMGDNIYSSGANIPHKIDNAPTNYQDTQNKSWSTQNQFVLTPMANRLEQQPPPPPPSSNEKKLSPNTGQLSSLDLTSSQSFKTAPIATYPPGSNSTPPPPLPLTNVQPRSNSLIPSMQQQSNYVSSTAASDSLMFSVQTDATTQDTVFQPFAPGNQSVFNVPPPPTTQKSFSTTGLIGSISFPPAPQPIMPPHIESIPSAQTFPPISNAGLPPPPPSSNNSLTLSNPFKRSSNSTHKNIQNAPVVVSTNFYPSEANQELLHDSSENAENPNDSTIFPRHIEIENHEIAPHNDRNQYLQTGHLSEDGYASNQQQAAAFIPDSNENLPPPGLSRYVLGQLESNNSASNNASEPPPGLDRMIPGTDLTNSTQLNLEREADGQDTTTSLRNINNSFAMTPPLPLISGDNQQNLIITDRNLYLVPGDESDEQVQRVVTGGLEQTRASQDHQQQQQQQPTQTSIASQQRELVMDGENLNDEHQQIPERNEPIEGANMLDDAQQTNSNLAESETNLPHDNKKFTSNPSTCNDDSDKERERQPYFNRSSVRRSEEPVRRRHDKNAYDTEDTDYYSDREKERRRFNRDGREGSVRREKDTGRSKEAKENIRDDRDLTGRDKRDNRSARGDKSRDGSKREGYGRDRYSRYETDGSRYETEDSRYDRQDQRRRGGADERRDEQYRRGERGPDSRRRG